LITFGKSNYNVHKFYKHDEIESPGGLTKTGFLGGLLLIGKGNLGWAAKLIIN
jgi:hypothetical protein